MAEARRPSRRSRGAPALQAALARLADALREDRARRSSIAWRGIPGERLDRFTGEHAGGRFEIRPDMWGRSILRYEWAAGGGRDLAAVDSPPAAMRVADAIAAEGGPFGGPARPTHSPHDLPRWSTATPPGEGIVIGFGAGFELRIRPVCDGVGVLTLVSPLGSFTIYGTGSVADLAFAACRLYLLADPWRVTPLLAGAFHVYAGERLVILDECRVPGILGVGDVGGDVIMLATVGAEELVLARVDEQGEVRLVARGPLDALQGVDVGVSTPRDDPAPVRGAPEVVDAIRRLTEAPELARDRLCGLVDALHKDPGAATCRGILVAIAVAVAAGHRGSVSAKTEPLMGWLHEHGQMSGSPCDGARRRALRWLAENCDFVRREGPRSHRWTIDFERLCAV